MRIAFRIAALLTALLVCTATMAQPKPDPNIKKPKEFTERKLGSEKMADKKFTLPRHFFQNLYTHYNYYFNANNKLKEIVEAAKLQHQEDYSRLLPFYNYSFEATSHNSQIDSILEKCTAGILLHDLRNDWIDNLYLIMGRAYMLRKDFDSAAMTFQFINYTYSPKEKDGYTKVIGSNSSEGSNAFSIATKEKSNIAKKILSQPPSRNESFVWQIRNYIENGEYVDASSLITTLRNDPNFPPRLKEELSEVEAYNYYKQEIYDSSANYLVKAVSLAENRNEKARWYYLIGQMYQMTGHKKEATDYFTKCVNMATDPVMEVYARLSSIRLRKADDPKIVQENIDELVKMARKEKYEPYRDIIYYAAALIELERNGYAMAETFLKKSIQYNTDNTAQRSKSFLLLSDMLYDNKAYGRSGFYYDSVNTQGMETVVAGRVTYRKPPTKSIYDQDRIIFAQDSLQKIAAMPEAERNNYLRALAKRLRKEKGLKDSSDVNSSGQAVNPFAIGKGTTPLFDDGSSKDFYFYNAQQRSQGFNEFKQRWGSRPNVDNWQRSAAVQNSFNTGKTPAGQLLTDQVKSVNDIIGKTSAGNAGSPVDINQIYDPADISFDALSTNLPVSQESLSASNKNINEAMLLKGKALENSIEDLPEAIKVYEALLARLSENDMAQEVMFNLIYCYNKLGETAKADALKKRLNSDFKNGDFTKRANNPNLGTERDNLPATAAYKNIYNEFIEGNFGKAVADKKKADSVYGNGYWNPQLLYIESVYYIKERQDTTAINRLNLLAATYPTSPLAAKAKTLADVLGRRSQIEDYLTKLQVTRATDDSAGSIPAYTPPAVQPVVTTPVKDVPNTTPPVVKLPNKDSLNAVALAAASKQRKDSIANAATAKLAAKEAAQKMLAAAKKAKADSIQNANTARMVADKFAKESAQKALAAAKQARADSIQKATSSQLAAAKSAKDSARIVQAAAAKAKADSLKEATAAKLLAAKERQDSIKEATAIKLAAAKVKADSLKEANLAKITADNAAKAAAKEALAQKNQERKDSIANALTLQRLHRADSIANAVAQKKIADSLAAVQARLPKPVEGFTVNPAEPQTVMVLLKNVDAIYLNECVNAFNRYHEQRLSGQLITQKVKLNAEYGMVTVSSTDFKNAAAALDYISKVKPKASTEIIPWLEANKFSFYIISSANLELLKQNQKVEGYIKALQTALPGKF